VSEHEQERLTDEMKGAKEILQTSTAPRADAAFRARLKGEFVSGRITGGTVPIPRPWYRRAAAPAAVAAAAVIAVVAGFLNRGPDWIVTSASGDGIVQIDGEQVAIADLNALRARVRPGVEIQVPGSGEIAILSAGALAIQLTAGTELTVPPPPPRWFGRVVELYARAGELRITTGPRFSGARLLVRTPDAEVDVTGTTLAVILNPLGTCVCVFEGTVKLGTLGGELTPVPAGTRRQMFRDGNPPVMEPIRDMERMKLGMFRDASLPLLSGEPPQ
jgi:ferric-dicitrate binding protein FerR (iron transport regulator)